MIDNFLLSFDYAASTRLKYRRILAVFLDEFPDPGDLTPGQLLSWLDGRSTWGNSSSCVALSAIKAFLKWGYGSSHPALTVRIKRKSAALQRSLSGGQALQLLSSFDTSRIKGRRDLSMCALFFDSGLRVSELASLDLKYLDLERGTLQVRIKGGNFGSAVFSEYTASLIWSWLSDRARLLAPGEQAVFVGTHKNKGHRLTRGGIGKIVKKWGERAEIGALSPHDFRRSFATLATRRGAPARILMEAGRWRSPDLIERYTGAIEQDDFRAYFPISGIMGL